MTENRDPAAREALSPANPKGGVVFWRNVLVHNYGMDLAELSRLTDEWVAAGCPGGYLGAYTVQKKLISEQDAESALQAYEHSRRLEVVIDEDENASTLELIPAVTAHIPGFFGRTPMPADMPEPDSTATRSKEAAGDAGPVSQSTVKIEPVDNGPDATDDSDNPAEPSPPRPVPKPVLPVPIKESIEKRGFLPGQTSIYLRKKEKSDKPKPMRPKMRQARRIITQRPSFGERKHTRRLARKTLLLSKPKPSDSMNGKTSIMQPTPGEKISEGLPASGTKLGDLWLTRVLGQGGCSVVYQALHTQMRIPVAVKLLKPHIQKQHDYRAAFRREAAVMANLSHPNIVCVIDFFELDGRDVLVLEYVDGLPLSAIIQAAGRIIPRNLIPFVLDICTAMQEALNQGIIHRDMKPANFLLTSSLNVKISDFGLASLYNPLSDDVVSRSESGEHAISGTPVYIAPEQSFPGAEKDHRADIYSLGISMYQMLAGRPPFVSDDPAELIFHHRESEPPPLGDIVSGIPLPLAELVSDMIKKDPDARPFDYKEIRSRLEEMLKNT